MMDDNEEEYTPNLQNYPPIKNVLQSWEGKGDLSWRDNAIAGDFMLSRLLNGRLRFVFRPHDWQKSNAFIELHDLEFNGIANDESSISVTGIHFTRRYLDEMPWEICVGFARKASRILGAETDTVSVRCDLTNYSLNQRIGDVEFALDGFSIRISPLWWGKHSSGVEEHAIAYQHAYLPTCLMIENISLSEAPKAINCLQEITKFLSIACRGNTSIAAQHIFNQEEGRFHSLFEEPPFPIRKWGRPLIKSDVIEEYLVKVCSVNRSREQNLALAFVTDHYLQSLTLRSAWPQSVGIFTAMESLKTAFFNQNSSEENESYNFWVVPPEDFESNKIMIKEIISVLAKHFPRFSELSQDEKQSLEAQIKHGLKRRSYKTHLKRMLDLLDVQYLSRELQFFVNTRNRLIHEGTPVSADTPLSEYDEKSATAWQHVMQAVGLFERALLSFLNYDGPRELFNEGFTS